MESPSSRLSGARDNCGMQNRRNYRYERRRSVMVVPAEVQDGSTEYKRQLYNPSPSRLRSLATQMSYRLDQGQGKCTYVIGVEDDGRHSMLDYRSVMESCNIVECIAKSLNSIVMERRVIQNEVDKNGDRVCVKEDMDGGFEKEEKSEEGGGCHGMAGIPTRCEMVIERVETHVLDAFSLSLSALTKAVSEVSMQSAGGKQHGADNGNHNKANKAPSKESSSASSASPQPNSNVPSKVPQNNSNKKTEESQPPSQEESLEDTLSSRNIRVAVVGNVDAGKSTLIGTLTTSCLDDGRGRSRTSIMKHRHEIESGRTSTATTHLMGFRATGEPIAGNDKIRANKRKSEDEVARESHRIVTLMDLAGHEKYFKTTIHGVSSGMADYALILVNARHPPTHMTQHHLNLCCSFGIPVIVVFTKIDACPDHAIKNSKLAVMKLLRAPDIAKKPFTVRNEQDIATCMGKLHTLAPMIEISCVTGDGLNLLRKILFSLPKRRRHENKVNRPFEFLIEDIFNVPGVGAVASGFVNAGELTVGPNTHVYVGPMDDGKFIKTVAKSAHIARINTAHVTSGQSACLAFALNKDNRKLLRRGMVVLMEDPIATREFDAEICVLKGEGTTIRKSYQAYVHILNVRQSAFAKNIELVNNNAKGLPPSHAASIDDADETNRSIVLRPGCRAKVRFEFAKRPEYIRPGMRMLFRDGRVRGVGIITGVPSLPQLKT